MAQYHDPKTKQTIEASNKKSAVAKMVEANRPKPTAKKKAPKVQKTDTKETK